MHVPYRKNTTREQSACIEALRALSGVSWPGLLMDPAACVVQLRTALAWLPPSHLEACITLCIDLETHLAMCAGGTELDATGARCAVRRHAHVLRVTGVTVPPFVTLNGCSPETDAE